MSLRFRLFFWIGALFLISFVLSYFLEKRLTDKSVVESSRELRRQILIKDEEQRQNIEHFLKNQLDAARGRIDTLLPRLSVHLQFSENDFLNDEQKNRLILERSCHFLYGNKELDFLQVDSGQRIDSTVIPDISHFKTARKFSDPAGFSWIAIQEGTNMIPCIGISISSFFPQSNQKKESFLLFHPQQLMAGYSKDTEEKDGISDLFGNRFEKDWGPFVEQLNNVGTALQTLFRESAFSDAGAWVEHELQQQLKKQGRPVQNVLCIPSQDADLNQVLLLTKAKDSQLEMLWILSSFLSTGLFGDSPLSSSAPIGMVQFTEAEPSGMAFFNKDTIYDQSLYQAGSFLKNDPANPSCLQSDASPALISPPGLARTFFGGSIESVLEKPSTDATTKASITIGMDLGGMLKNLSVLLNETVILVTDNQIREAFSAKGGKLSIRPFQSLQLQEILKNSAGIIEFEGNSYFFFRFTPLKNVELHFLSLNLVQKEFVLLDYLKQITTHSIANISWAMRLVAFGSLCIFLLCLNFISKKMSRPIYLLAQATRSVGKGHLDEVHLPDIKGSAKDEIHELYHSFAEMVQGLKEKEKVKGVLNKVVSSEIAQEILRGNVHLGGEEREVTVLFADVRNFTRMTQNMPPHEVINLLNACMTKISKVIDEFGGVIDKYVGDEVMALFGAPIAKQDNALHAVECALKMIEVLRDWNIERLKAGLPAVEMGVGIHTGLVVAGNMGSENRLNYTVLGSNVNLAARLCSAATGMHILISEDTFARPHVKEAIEVQEMPSMTLKGFDKPVKVYSVNKLIKT